jgi:hypothetical protein
MKKLILSAILVLSVINVVPISAAPGTGIVTPLDHGAEH